MVFPPPSTLSRAARAAFAEFVTRGDPPLTGDIADVRRTFDAAWVQPAVDRWSARSAFKVEETTIAGVRTDVVTPSGGLTADRETQVLISLHGGGFVVGGGGPGGLAEAVPLTVAGGFRVVAVDYRMAPEETHPAALDDLLGVYEALTVTYDPERIGVYGTSAGAVLAGQLVGRLQRQGRPGPGAVMLMAARASPVFAASDCSVWAMNPMGGFLGSTAIPPMRSYLSAEHLQDPELRPLDDPEVAGAFPPTRLVSSTRDTALASVLAAHAQLLDAGVEVELDVRDGFGHGFFVLWPDLPESQSVWRAAARFFDRRLSPR